MEKELIIKLALNRTQAEASGKEYHANEKRRVKELLTDVQVAEKAKAAVIDQTNNSRARFQGLATVTVDGTTSTNPFTVEGVDGAGNGSSAVRSDKGASSLRNR